MIVEGPVTSIIVYNFFNEVFKKIKNVGEFTEDKFIFWDNAGPHSSQFMLKAINELNNEY